MNEMNFKHIGDISNYEIRFKCFTDDRDGYQAVFHVYNKSNIDDHYQINFEIGDTDYCKDINSTNESTENYIQRKYGDIEDCFKGVGFKYLEEEIIHNRIKNETVDLMRLI